MSSSRNSSMGRSINTKRSDATTATTATNIWATRPVEWPAGKIAKATVLPLLQHARLLTQSTARSSSTEPSKIGDDPNNSSTQDGSLFSGLMHRVLHAPAASNTSSGTNTDQEWTTAQAQLESQPHPWISLKRPPKCVTVSNGWIVAVSELALSNNSITLPLLSRWNVRRSATSSDALIWTVLPLCRVVGIFLDPTGSHTLISADNGCAFYIHSSQPKVSYRLAGFGAGGPARQQQPSDHNTSTNTTGLSGYVTAVAWDKEKGTEGSTKTILLGTNLGEIYEYILHSPAGDEKLQQPVLLHKLYSGSDDAATTGGISGLFFERLRTGLLVLVSTSGKHKRTRMYSFYSPHNKSFRMVFADSTHATLQELPGSVDHADLKVSNDHFALRTQYGIYYGSMDRSLSAVLAGGGSRSSMLVDCGMLRYEDLLFLGSGGGNKNPVNPHIVSLAVTPHHIVILDDARHIFFVNRVSQQVIQADRLEGSEESMTHGEFMMDVRRPDQIWLRRGRSLVHISSSQEDRDVWKYHLTKALEMGSRKKPESVQSKELNDDEKVQETMFEQSKTSCSVASQKAVVTAVRAEYHLRQGRGELAAKYFAQCPPSLEPFADTAIRLALPKLGVDDPKGYGSSRKARQCLESSNIPLIGYLNDKMRIGSSNDDKMTCTMIGAWLTELFLHERSEQIALGETIDANQQRILLAQFLNANVDNMDAKTIMKILTSHDVGSAECAGYATTSGDIGTAVNAALSAGERDTAGAFEALRILAEAPFEQAENLYYKHAPVLLARAPTGTAESFLSRYAEGLSPLRMLPFIMNYEKTRALRAKNAKVPTPSTRGEVLPGGTEESKIDQKYKLNVGGTNESRDGFELKIESNTRSASFVDDSSVAIKYLEGVIRQGCRAGAVFRYLMSLYTVMEDEEPLYQFLSSHVPATSTASDASKKAILSGDRPSMTDDTSSTPLDMSYALRTVLGTGRHFRSAIKLYMGFGMRQQAVELALKVDPSLARQLAQDSIELDERKRLWLMIAKSAASDGSARGGKDVVARVVAVLKDCGPDVLSIEDVLPFLPDFAQIDQIKDEICEALTSYSSKIEGYLREMNDCDQTCDTLRDEISKLRNYEMRLKTDACCALTGKRVLTAGEPFYAFPSGFVVLSSALLPEVVPYLTEEQQARVQDLEQKLQSASDATASQTIRTDLDGLIAAECPLTGSVMVDSIDKGFDVKEDDFGELNNTTMQV